MSRTCQISSGPVSGADYTKEPFLDTLIHGWDIAIGSKQDTTLDSYLVEQCMPLGQAIAYDDNYGAAFKAQPPEVTASTRNLTDYEYAK